MSAGLSPERFSLALFKVVPADEIRNWLAKAEPLESVVYASGLCLKQDDATVHVVRAWEAAGLVQLAQRRDPAQRDLWQWIVQKSASASAPMADGGNIGKTEASPSQQAEALLNHLRALAAKGAPCPSNLALAHSVGLVSSRRFGKPRESAQRRVRYLLQGLCDAQHIRITPGSGAQHSARPARHKARIVTILTGKHAGKSTGEG